MRSGFRRHAFAQAPKVAAELKRARESEMLERDEAESSGVVRSGVCAARERQV